MGGDNKVAFVQTSEGEAGKSTETALGTAAIAQSRLGELDGGLAWAMQHFGLNDKQDRRAMASTSGHTALDSLRGSSGVENAESSHGYATAGAYEGGTMTPPECFSFFNPGDEETFRAVLDRWTGAILDITARLVQEQPHGSTTTTAD